MDKPNYLQPAAPVMHPTGTYTGFTKHELASLMLLQGMLSNPQAWEELSHNEMVVKAKTLSILMLEER